MGWSHMYWNWGGAERLRWAHIPEVASAPLAAGSVRISVTWAGVNPADWKILSGRYRLFCKGGFPRRIGTEGSGRVLAVGANVALALKPGMRVVFGLDPRDGRWGSWADWVDVPAERVVPLPDAVSERDAAVLPVSGLTAWLMCERAQVRPGMSVLVTGASGGVGSFAVQLSRLRGALVTATASAPRRSMALDLGAEDFIDYRDSALATCRRRWHAVLDCVNSVSRAQSAALLKPAGRYVDTDPRLLVMFADLWRGLGRRQKWQTVRVGMHRTAMEHLLRELAAGRLRSVISRERPMTEAADALRESIAGHATGKLVLSGLTKDAERNHQPLTN